MNAKIFTALSFALLVAGFLPGQSTYQLTIAAGSQDRAAAPVYFALPAAMQARDVFRLTETETGRQHYAQRWKADSAVFILDRTLAAGRSRTYELRGVENRPVPTVAVTQDAETVRISVGDQSVLVYHTATVQPPAGSPDYYRRSGHIHPLYSPEGQVLSDGFPVGHTHQHGVFLTWVNTTFRGDFTDFWNQQSETGTVRHIAVLDTVSGPVFARLQVRLEHVSLQHGPVLEETRTITVYRRRAPFLVDIDSEQWTVTDDSLLINEYHYGGMAFRGSAQWNAVDSLAYRHEMQVLTGAGKARSAANHTRPRWTAAYGPVDGNTAGVALFDHPANFRFPQPVRVHPEMPYFVYAPMVAGAFSIRPGDRYRSRYRFLVYQGTPAAKTMDAQWQIFAEPPPVKVKKMEGK